MEFVKNNTDMNNWKSFNRETDDAGRAFLRIGVVRKGNNIESVTILVDTMNSATDISRITSAIADMYVNDKSVRDILEPLNESIMRKISFLGQGCSGENNTKEKNYS